MRENGQQKVEVSGYEIHPLLVKRRSPRSFATKAVESEKLRRVFEAARWSASSFNEQPWRFIVGVKGYGSSYEKIFNSLSAHNQRWAQYAPVLAIGVAKKAFTHSGNPNRFFGYDVGQAVAYLTVQAMVEGLFVRQMGSYSADQARAAFSIPDDFEPMAAMAIGYTIKPDHLPDDIQAQELKPRSRRSLEETVFSESWGKMAEIFE